MHACVDAMHGLDIRQATDARDWGRLRSLLTAYAAELDVDIAFQGFGQELDGLAMAYPPPGGAWLVFRAGLPVGCVALRPLGDGFAELKRLFTVPEARGCGVGRALVKTALGAARAAGFSGVRLDTLRGMDAAQALYASLGFVPIAPYRANPLAGAAFLELAFSVRPP
jgi:putative acetyltransferase